MGADQTVLLLFFGALMCVVSAAGFEKEGGLIILTNKNYIEAFETHTFLLVEFYTSKCERCETLQPEIEKAAQILSEVGNPVVFAKMDALANRYPKKFGFATFPVLMWFEGGKNVTSFSGENTAEEIVKWVVRRTLPPCKELHNKHEVDVFQKSAEVVVVGFFEPDSPQFKEFEQTARSQQFDFGVVNNPEIAKQFGVSIPSIILFKTFDGGRVEFSGEFAKKEISFFVFQHGYPLVPVFSAANVPKYAAAGFRAFFFHFTTENDPALPNAISLFHELAPEYRKSQLLFTIVGSDSESLLEYFQVRPAKLPISYFAFLSSRGGMSRFLFQNELTADNVRSFLAEIQGGKVRPTPPMKSDPAPQQNSGPVLVVVAITFDEIVLDNEKDVLIMAYAPWCPHSKALFPILDRLAQHYREGGGNDIVFSTFDATTNYVERISIASYPTVLLFPAGNKDQPASFTSSVRDYESLIAFVEENATTLRSKRDNEPRHPHEEL